MAFNLVKTILKTLLERDPPYFELFGDYEEYHKRSLLNPMYEVRYQLISPWIRPRTRILDVGCGEGYFMERLAREKGAIVHGIDISHTAVKKLKEKGFEAYVRDVNVEGLKLEVQQFYDYILFIEVLEHLKFPHRVLREACNHVNEGIIITIPNTRFIRWRLQMLKGYFPRQSFTHLHYWTIKDFKIFLEQIGLKPIEVRTEIDLVKDPIKRKIGKVLQNLLAYQQAWLVKCD